jgi:Domain of unknown function (DUF4838)
MRALWLTSLLWIAITAAPAMIVRDGRSAYRIYVAPGAPASVQEAARELRHYIAQATGAELPILTAATAPAGPLISLGENAASRAAGLSARSIPLEGYRIASRGGNLFILGPDTLDGEQTPRGGTSAGTRNGVFTFLEAYLNIRWLMPGDAGEDVPHTAALALPRVDRTDRPFFLNRRLPYIQNNDPRVQAWQRRQKLGFSLRLEHSHNWQYVVPPALFDQHPDWFAEIGGERVRPVGDRYKLETTNPELVRFYADRAREAFRRDPKLTVFSLSPTDSAGYSESAASRALTEKDAHGRLSVTPLILKFYNDVARLVRPEFPERLLCGYIYADYLYPPAGAAPRLEPNLFLVVAPHIDYGYQLFRPRTQEDLRRIMAAWTRVTPKIAFYDLPNQLTQDLGAPLPPGREILRFLFPLLAQQRIQGVYIYGDAAWGYGAVTNYLLARLMWNPRADVDVLFREFCERAYGQAAGRTMERLYDLLDAAMKEHYLGDPTASYTLTPAILRDVYVRHWPEIEALFLQAQNAARDPRHQARLAQFGQNVLLMRWYLVAQRLIPADTRPPLHRSDAQIDQMLAQGKDDLALPPASRAIRGRTAVDVVTVQPAPAPLPNAPPAGRPTLRGRGRLLLYPLGDHEITITFPNLTSRGELVRYRISDSLGAEVAAGVLQPETSLRFNARERQPYFLDVAAGGASYQVAVRGCPYAVKTSAEPQGLHMLGQTSPLHFYVPEKVRSFHVTLHSDAPGETSAAEVRSPSGRVAGKLDTTERPTDRQTIDTTGEQPGFWSILFQQPRRGIVDDVWIQLDETALAPWVSVDPAQALIVTPTAPGGNQEPGQRKGE